MTVTPLGRKHAIAAAAVVSAAAASAGAVATLSRSGPAAAAQEPPVTTARVERGKLSDMVSQYGTLTYRARPDGSPYIAFNRARGTYTALPEAGDEVDCGDVLYRVDDEPVLLLCGPTPSYRTLSRGARGPDVAELNADLVRLGYASRAQLDPSSARFGQATAAALEKLQARLGVGSTGSLRLGQAVFLPQRVRVSQVNVDLGGAASPGAPVLSATSDTLEVQVDLDPAQQGEVTRGDPVRVTLPGNSTVTGKVVELGRVAQLPAGQGGGGAPTIPASIDLDQPARARGLDRAPVQVTITTRGIENALSVPVTAIVGRAGGGFAVERVRGNGQRELVPVELGLFDTAGGRVQVEGGVRAGDRVVVPTP